MKAWADAQAADLDSTAGAVRVALSSLAGVEGRKVLFFVTEHLTPHPARDLFDYLQHGMQNAGTSGRRSPGSASAGGPINDLVWKQWDHTEAFKDITSSANVAGVSIVTIDAAGLGFDDSLSPETNLGYPGKDRRQHRFARHADGDGLPRRGDRRGDDSGRQRPRGRVERARSGLDGVLLARLRESRHEARSAEIPQGRRPSARRARENAAGRHREDAGATGRRHGALGSYIPHVVNLLHASLRIGTPKKSGKLWLAPFEFKIPFEKLTLVPQGDRARGAVLFTAVTAAPNGKVSKVTTERAPLDIPASELGRIAGKTFTYLATLKVRAGAQVFSTALTDEVSRLTSYVQPQVLIADRPAAR